MRNSLALATAFAFALSACSSIRHSTKVGGMGLAAKATEEECSSFDSKYLMWGAIAAGAAVASGAGGLATAVPEEDQTKLTFGIASLVIGLAGAVSVFLSQNYAQRYTDRCVENPR